MAAICTGVYTTSFATFWLSPSRRLLYVEIIVLWYMLSVNIWPVIFEALLLLALPNLKVGTKFSVMLHFVIASWIYDGCPYEQDSPELELHVKYYLYFTLHCVNVSTSSHFCLKEAMHFLVLAMQVSLWLLTAFFYYGSDNHLQLEVQVPLLGKKKPPFKRITGFQVSSLETLTLHVNLLHVHWLFIFNCFWFLCLHSPVLPKWSSKTTGCFCWLANSNSWWNWCCLQIQGYKIFLYS